jgi:hypothetical protein
MHSRATGDENWRSPVLIVDGIWENKNIILYHKALGIPRLDVLASNRVPHLSESEACGASDKDDVRRRRECRIERPRRVALYMRHHISLHSSISQN